MPKYQVSVLNARGGSQEFELYAENAKALESHADERGWVVLRWHKVRDRRAKIGNDELVLLCQHLRLILDAGLPVHDALNALAEESESRAMSELCMSAAHRIDRGESLSQALADSHLDAFFLAMVRTGESTGRLPELLDRAANHLQWREDLRSSVLHSLSYPLLVLGCLLLLVPFLFIYLVPQLMGFLGNLSAEIPWYTELLIGLADFAQSHWEHLLIGGLIFTGLLLLLWRTSQAFRAAMHYLAIRIPLLGPMLLQLNTAQMCEQLGIMYGAGIPVAQALPLVAGSVDNVYLKHHLHSSCASLEKGESLYTALPSEVFPSLMLRLIKVGELSGKLELTLEQSAQLYSRYARRRAGKLSAAIGPAVLLFAGGLIVWLVAALILPLYDGLFSMGAGM